MWELLGPEAFRMYVTFPQSDPPRRASNLVTLQKCVQGHLKSTPVPASVTLRNFTGTPRHRALRTMWVSTLAMWLFVALGRSEPRAVPSMRQNFRFDVEVIENSVGASTSSRTCTRGAVAWGPPSLSVDKYLPTRTAGKVRFQITQDVL